MKMLRYKIILSFLLVASSAMTTFGKMNVGNRPKRASQVSMKVSNNCPNTTAQIDLDINQVRARVLVGGDLWWDPIGQIPFYEVPIGSNKNSIYAGALWIGGFDQNNQLKVAAQTYRQSGSNDFWGGPIDTAGLAPSIDSRTCDEYDRFWDLTRAEVANFANGGEATANIKDWPGNGDLTRGELPFLAPFFDANNDGTYNYEDGDYPYFLLSGDYGTNSTTGKTECNDYLFGDKSIWWVFNDVGNIKTESQSDPIGLEIRAQAFGFKTANEVNYMTFYKYQIINRSSDELDSTYFGVWCDPDLGNASDDLVGCDVGLGLGYVYNGDPDDDGGDGYGLNPPAAGIDFFQGPLADPFDGIDNNKDGTIDEPGEQIIMSRFVYYANVNNQPTGNPDAIDDYYEYLSGSWLDGATITYGGDGRGNGPGATATPCEYMFPGTTDPKFSTEWTMVTGGIQPTDMRFLQSAGIFTLLPGAVNYITTGVIWQRTTVGGPLASVSLLKLADEKAQAIFDNCFKILDGPDAPDVAVRELDKKIILTLENTGTRKIELYNEIDAVIPKYLQNSTGGFDTLTDAQRSYKFQGYKVYQVADETVSDADVKDPVKVRLIAQIDLKDNIGQIINYEFDNNLNSYVPVEYATNVNNGIFHTFEITKDLFTQKPLVNYKPYYFLVVSYCHNNFKEFDPTNGQNTQTRSYVQGRNNVAVYSAIPHATVVENGGTVINAAFGSGVQIKRIEGQGNGGNVADFTDATVNEILTSPLHRSANPVHQVGKGPIGVKVYDPVGVKGGGFKLAFEGVSDSDYWYLYNSPNATYTLNNVIASLDSMFFVPSSNMNLKVDDFVTVSNATGLTPSINKSFQVVQLREDTIVVKSDPRTGTYDASSGTIVKAAGRSTYTIDQINEQSYAKNKISLGISKINGQEPGNFGAPNNGLIESSLTFSNPSDAWLSGIADAETPSSQNVLTNPKNWILSGTQSTVDLQNNSPSYFLDSTEAYENVIKGTWAPWIMATTSRTITSAIKPTRFPGTNSSLDLRPFVRYNYLHSVDVVITPDKSKWTRSVVFELGEDTMPNIGGAKKFTRRLQASVDKNGNAYGSPNANAAEAGLTDSVGMGWFPGYAINVETGERLNISFGENSSLVNENSTDMRWNPTSNQGTDINGRISFGGMHYIYIHTKDTINLPGVVGIYDEGKVIDSLATRFNIAPTSSTAAARALFRTITWVSMPVVADGFTYNPNTSSEAKVRIRVKRNYKQFVSIGETAVNGGNPLYEFTVPTSYEPSFNVSSEGKKALDLISVIPNPYYAYSTYEKTRKDQLDNRVRIVNLPSKCTVSIYTMNGTLVRKFRRDVKGDVSSGLAVSEGRDDNLSTSLDWDLKNTAGITVGSGVYIIHVDAGSLGEAVVKWFGIMRPIDLDSF